MNKQNGWSKIVIWIVLIVVGAQLLAGCSSAPRVGALKSESKSVELADGKPVRVEIGFGAGSLQLSGGAAKLLEAGFDYNVARLKPQVSFKDGKLSVQQPEADGFPVLAGITGFRNDWALHLNNTVPMDLSVDVGGGTSDLAFTGLSLTGLDIKIGAGIGTIDLTGEWQRDLDVSIDVGASVTTVRLPGDIGVRVDVDAGPTIVDAPDFNRDGTTYTNASYGQSDVTLALHVDSGIGKITLVVDEAAASVK